MPDDHSGTRRFGPKHRACDRDETVAERTPVEYRGVAPGLPHRGMLLGARYILLDSIGRGASGWVWRAHDERSGRVVAVKILAPRHGRFDEVDATRMLREAAALTRVRHPNVIELRTQGMSACGTPYIVMEYLDGENLRDLLARGRVPLDEALSWGGQMLGAIAAAHHVGVLHRDIKPANVLVTREGRVKVLDFGLARLHGLGHGAESESGGWTGRLTDRGALLGTPATMSPEQLLGEDADTRSDMYSVGCVLYHLFAGRGPVSGKATRVVYEHVYVEPIPLRELAPAGTPQSLCDLVHACLSKDPAHRPTSRAAALEAAHWNAQSGNSLSRATGTLRRLLGTSERRGPDRPKSARWLESLRRLVRH